MTTTVLASPTTADSVYGVMSVVREGSFNPAAVQASSLPTVAPTAQDDGPARPGMSVAGVMDDPVAWLVASLGAAFLLARFAAG